MSIDPQAKKILDFIGGLEAPQGYDQYFGDNPHAPPKPLTKMTIREVIDWQRESTEIHGSYSSAAGRYQIIRSTLRGLINKGIVSENDLFDEGIQDALGMELMREKGYDRWRRGQMSPIEFGNRLAGTWAALPQLSGDNVGKSVYAGDSVNKALTSTHAFLEVLGADAEISDDVADATSAAPSSSRYPEPRPEAAPPAESEPLMAGPSEAPAETFSMVSSARASTVSEDQVALPNQSTPALPADQSTPALPVDQATPALPTESAMLPPARPGMVSNDQVALPNQSTPALPTDQAMPALPTDSTVAALSTPHQPVMESGGIAAPLAPAAAPSGGQNEQNAQSAELISEGEVENALRPVKVVTERGELYQERWRTASADSAPSEGPVSPSEAFPQASGQRPFGEGLVGPARASESPFATFGGFTRDDGFWGDVWSEFSDSGVLLAAGAAYDRLRRGSSRYDPDFKFWEAPGFDDYQDHWRILSTAQNAEDYQRLLQHVQLEIDRRARIDSGGRMLAPFLGAVLQPESIASMWLIPGASGAAWLLRSKNATRATLKSATSIGAQTALIEGTSEAFRQENNPLATRGEAAMRIGLSAMLAGSMGGVLSKYKYDKARKLLADYDADMQAITGIAHVTKTVKSGRGKTLEVRYDGDGSGGAAAHVSPDGKRVHINTNKVAQEWETGEYTKHGFSEADMPTPQHWAEFRARLAAAQREADIEEIPFGDEGLDMPDHIVVNGKRIDIETGNTRRGAQFDKKNGKVTLTPEKLKRAFARKAWTKPNKQRDGTRADPIPEDAFETYEDFVNFVLNHELMHARFARQAGETQGAYETRINNAALKSGDRHIARPGEGLDPDPAMLAGITPTPRASAGGGAPPGGGGSAPGATAAQRAHQQAMRSWKKWTAGNKRQLKGRIAKIIDRMVDGPYKRIHRNAKDGFTRNLMDILALDGGIQTIAMAAGETPGASIDTLQKLWQFQTQKLYLAETAAYEKYLGFSANPTVMEMSGRRMSDSARGLASRISGGRIAIKKRADGRPSMGIDEFRKAAAKARITGKTHPEPAIADYVKAIDDFYTAFREGGIETGALGQMSPQALARRLDEVHFRLGEEARVDKAGKRKRPASGIHVAIEIAFADDPGGYEGFLKDLRHWREVNREIFEAREAIKKDLDQIKWLLDEWDTEKLVLDTTKYNQATDMLRDRGHDLIVIEKALEPTGPRPEPPWNMANPEHRLLRAELDDMRSLRFQLEELHYHQKNAAMDVIDNADQDYFSRVYDRGAIEKHPELFRATLKNALKQTGRPDEVVDKMIDDLMENLLQKGDVTNVGALGESLPSFMKRRGFNIPNKALVDVTGPNGEKIDFIDLDPILVGSNYQQRMGAFIEFARRFNETGMADPHLEFRRALRGAFNREKAAYLNENPSGEGFLDHWATIERDLLMMRDRVLHATMTEPWRWDNRATSVLKDWATLAFMGRAVISTLPDLGKTQMVHGLDEVARFAQMELDANMRPLLRSLKNEARQAGALTDVVMGGLIKKFTEAGVDPVFLSKGERLLRTATNRYFLLNMLGPATYAMRSYSGAISAHRFMDDAVKVASGTASPEAIARLAQYGIDEPMALRIAEEAAQGRAQLDTASGIWTPNSDVWADKGAVRAYRAAISQETDNTILVATAADKPAVVDGVIHLRAGRSPIVDQNAEKLGGVRVGEYWRIQSGLISLPFQFWNYTMAATGKIAAAGAENPNKRVLAGMASMMGLGYMALQIRTPEWAWDKMDPMSKMMRVVDQSGLTGVMSDYAYMFQNSIGGLTGINPLPFDYKWGREPSMTDAFMDLAGAGPSVARSGMYGLSGLITGNEQAQKSLNYVMPGQNHFLAGDVVRDAVGGATSFM